MVDWASLLESNVTVFLVYWLECCHVDINGEGDNGPPVLGVLLICEGLEERGDVLIQILHVRLLGELVDGDIGLGAHVNTRAALAVEIVQTLETLLTAGTVWVQLALAGLQQHALGYDGGTHGLVAGRGDVDHG